MLQQSTEMVEQAKLLPAELDKALNHPSSIVMVLPKASIGTSAQKFIAKFSATTDTQNVVKAENVAMKLA